ncbi:hypothetical protein EV121DRAFT_296073 [Schizophyllum commune]
MRSNRISNLPPGPETSGTPSTSSAAPQSTPWGQQEGPEAPVPNASPTTTTHESAPRSNKRKWQHMRMATSQAPQTVAISRTPQSEKDHAKYARRKAKAKQKDEEHTRTLARLAEVEGQRDQYRQELEEARATIHELRSRERDGACAELPTLAPVPAVHEDAAPAMEPPPVSMDIDEPSPQATQKPPPQEHATEVEVDSYADTPHSSSGHSPEIDSYADTPHSSSGHSPVRRPHEIGTHIGRELPPPLMDLTSYDGHPAAVPDIQFASGLRVCAPYLTDDDDWEKNALAFEEDMMRKAADIYQMSTDRPDMVWHREFSTYEDTAKVVDEGMSQGVVVVRGPAGSGRVETVAETRLTSRHPWSPDSHTT